MPRIVSVDDFVQTRLATAAAVTASGNSTDSTGFGRFRALRAALVVTALTGTTPTLNVTVEDSLDGGVTWFTVVTFAQKTAAGSEAVSLSGPFSDQLRVKWTVGGTTPSASFTVDVVAK